MRDSGLRWATSVWDLGSERELRDQEGEEKAGAGRFDGPFGPLEVTSLLEDCCLDVTGMWVYLPKVMEMSFPLSSEPLAAVKLS